MKTKIRKLNTYVSMFFLQKQKMFIVAGFKTLIESNQNQNQYLNACKCVCFHAFFKNTSIRCYIYYVN